MKKRYLAIALLSFTLTFTACNAKEEPREPVIIFEDPDGNIIGEDDELNEEPLEIEQEQDISSRETGKQEKIKYDKEQDIYDLTAEEIKAFEGFQKSFDIQVFKDLEPLSIGKIWIYSGIVSAWESEYKMYSTNSVENAFTIENSTQFDPYTLNNHYNLAISDMERENAAIESGDKDVLTKFIFAGLQLRGLKDATWVKDSEDKGHLEFVDGNDDSMIMKFEKQNNVWLLEYYPIG